MKPLLDFLKKGLSALLLCFFATSCSLRSNQKNVIVTTDACYDDFLALAYLLEKRNIKLEALTVSGIGMSYPKDAAQNLINFLAYAKEPQIPVSFQSNEGLCSFDSAPNALKDEAAHFYGVHLKKSQKEAKNVSCSDLIADRVLRSSEKVTLLCLSPLNDVCEFLINYPYLHNKIDQIIIVGGAIRSFGNIQREFDDHLNTVAKYNIALDPCSAEIVFKTQIPKVLCPLDLTNKLPLTREIYEEYSPKLTTSLGAFVKELMRNVLDLYPNQKLKFSDVAAAVYLTNPSIFETRVMKLSVDNTQGPHFGRVFEDPNGCKVSVMTRVNQNLFYKSFFNSMSKK